MTRAERQGRITPAEGFRHITQLLRTLPRLYSILPDLVPIAYDISSQERIGFYDCVYVALAEREQCEFLTADDKLVKKLQPTFPFIVSLSSLP